MPGHYNVIPCLGFHPEATDIAGLNTAGKLTAAINPHLPVVAIGTVVEDAVIVVKLGWFEPEADGAAFVINKIDRDYIIIRIAVCSG